MEKLKILIPRWGRAQGYTVGSWVESVQFCLVHSNKGGSGSSCGAPALRRVKQLQLKESFRNLVLSN